MSCIVCPYNARVRNKENRSELISLHKFPVDEKLRAQWISVIHRDDAWIYRKHHRVCSKHFSADCFTNTGKYRRLLDNSVPTLLLKRKPVTSVPIQKKSPRLCGIEMAQQIIIQENLDASILVPTNSPESCCLEECNFPHASEPVQQLVIELEESISATKPSNIHPATEKTGAESSDPTFITAGGDSVEELRKEIIRLKSLARKRLLKINSLKQRTLRLKKKNSNINLKLIEILEKEKVQKENLFLLECVQNNKVIERFLSQAKGDKPREYNLEVKKFAVTLHYLSPRAYNFVRDELNYALPHPKTIAKWYQGIDCDPGFTKEAMDAITERVIQNNGKPLYGALCIDEMAIRKLIEWDGRRYFRYVNVGCALNSDDVPLAKEALTFMVTSLNDTWKIPVGYFLIHSMTSLQKALLVEQCLTLLKETGIIVVSLTFDGASTNMAMCSHLGCDIKSGNSFLFENQNICLWPDPCHNIKLIRNAFAERKVLIDHKGQKISWHLIELLNELQNQEGLHLGNKLKDDHVNFIRQKMKVRLATQLLSQSVADALRFCNELGIPGFEDCEGTIQFITIFNHLFDIMNSRNMRAKGWKKALTSFNVDEVEHFFHDAEVYINGLRFEDDFNTNVLNSNRYTGFNGFRTCMKSLLQLYRQLVGADGSTLKYICTYKLSQDHIELFFGAIRSQGGYNNNPSARMFRAAYKKLLVHAQFKNGTNGNCVALENIKVLNYSMDFKTQINNTTINVRLSDEITENLPAVQEETDHNYIIRPSSISEYSGHVIHYMAGFVVKKLKSKIKCELCLQNLESNGSESSRSLLTIKDRGGLLKPSAAVIKICITAEKVYRENRIRTGAKKIGEEKNLLAMLTQVSASLQNLFDDDHSLDNGPLEDHKLLLIKCITKTYFTTRIHHETKRLVKDVEKIRTHLNKTILFRGQ